MLQIFLISLKSFWEISPKHQVISKVDVILSTMRKVRIILLFLILYIHFNLFIVYSLETLKTFPSCIPFYFYVVVLCSCSLPVPKKEGN